MDSDEIHIICAACRDGTVFARTTFSNPPNLGDILWDPEGERSWVVFTYTLGGFYDGRDEPLQLKARGHDLAPRAGAVLINLGQNSQASAEVHKP